jgi:hypothetical protein
MSVLKVNQIKAKLRAMFEYHLDLSDISEADKEREVKVLTRCLAALAIYVETGCSEKDAADAVWDGSDDNGIDAAYYDPSDSRVLFVQSKWIQKGSGEPAAAEIGTFTNGVKDAIEQDLTLFGDRLQSKLSDISAQLNTPGTRVCFVLISTGTSSLAKHGQARIDTLLNELNGNDPDPIASAIVMGLKEVYGRLANDPSHNNLLLEANILDWGYVATPYPAYFGMIDGLTLKGWWNNYGKRVVAANIRYALGSTEVNNEIKATALNSPEKFWYFNNGITLIAEEALKAPASVASKSAGVFSFKGASVVNGAQTISSLAKVADDSKLANVRVPIRVILLKTAPAGFGGEVTRTNNLQNRIEPRDFVAHDDEQKRLRQEMAIEEIDYQFVRSEESVLGPNSCELLEVTTALACASADSALAVQAKTGVSSRFFNDLTKPPYRTIFNPSLSGAKAYNAVLTLRAIDSWIEQKKRGLPKKSGQGWGVLVHGNRILAAAVFSRIGGGDLSQPIDTFAKALGALNIDSLCEDVYTKMVDAVQTYYPSKFLAVLFKNVTMSKHVHSLAS